jgi:AhpD family alkylhydroperoxidase
MLFRLFGRTIPHFKSTEGENDSMLTEKDQELIAIGTSIAAGCQPCTKYHFRAARIAGANDDEISQAVSNRIISAEQAAGDNRLGIASDLDRQRLACAQGTGAGGCLAHRLWTDPVGTELRLPCYGSDYNPQSSPDTMPARQMQSPPESRLILTRESFLETGAVLLVITHKSEGI